MEQTTTITTTTTTTIDTTTNIIIQPALSSSILFSNSKNSIIKQSKEKGRYVVAKQDIKAGESIVFREEPYSFCMNYKDPNERKICHHCFGLSSTNSKSMLTCPDFIIHCEDCKIVWYCSEYCKSKDFINYHSQECLTYKKLISSSQFDTQCKTSIKLLLKLIIKQYNEIKSNTTSDCMEDVKFKDILTLETNLNKFSTNRVTEFRMISKFIEKSLDSVVLKTICPTSKEVIEFQNNLIKLMCILECNSHDISFTIPSSNKSVYNYSSIGIGLYYHSSMFNHTCEPNICKVIESKQHPQIINPTIVPEFSGNFATHSMIAIRDIKKDEEISFNYIQLTLPKVDRIKKLETSYHFQCKCSSCKGDINNKNAIKSHNQFVEKHICKNTKTGCSGILFPLISDTNNNNNNSSNNNNYICNVCRPIIFTNRI